MSFFGDIFGAIGDVVGGVANVVAAPVELVIDAGARLLGMPPVFADALKVGIGALTGDWVVVATGALAFAKDLVGELATTEYVTSEDQAAEASGWSSAGTSSAAADGSSKAAGGSPRARRSAASVADASSDEDSGGEDVESSDPLGDAIAAGVSSLDDDDAEALAAFRVLLAHFDALDRGGGGFLNMGPSGVISRTELERISEDPSASIELKRAVRYLLDHPETFDRFGRSKGQDDQGLSRKDLDLAILDLGGGARTTSSGGGLKTAFSVTAAAASATATKSPDPAASDEAQAAYLTLRQHFDAYDRAQGFGLLGLNFTPDVITRGELQHVSDDPNASGILKTAARYLLDHPDVWTRLARSRSTLGLSGISRGDLDAAIASGTLPGGPGTTSGTGETTSGGGTKKSTSTGSGSGTAGRSALRDILNDKSLSNEEKIEAILMVLVDESDAKLVSTAKELDDAAAKRDKLKSNDKETLSKLDKLDRDLNFKLQRLTERKQKLETLLSNMQQKFTQMAMTAIVNLGR